MLSPDKLCLELIKAISYGGTTKELVTQMYDLYRLTKIPDVCLSKMGTDDATTFGDFHDFLTKTTEFERVFVRREKYELISFADFYARLRDFLAPFIMDSKRSGDDTSFIDLGWFESFGSWGAFMGLHGHSHGCGCGCEDDDDDGEEIDRINSRMLSFLICEDITPDYVPVVWRKVGLYLKTACDLEQMAALAKGLIEDSPLILPLHQAYITAFVEYAYSKAGAESPEWALDENYRLDEPYYSVDYDGSQTPIPEFVRRNLYVTEVAGDIVDVVN